MPPRIRRRAAARTSFSCVTAVLPDALDLLEPLRRRVDHLGKGAEPLQQPLGQVLGVAAGNGAEQHHLEQLVVGQRLRPAAHEALLQSLAMTGAQVGCRQQ